ncbi:MAG: alpha/beta fold hydrolase [Actinomycetota bacterium]
MSDIALHFNARPAGIPLVLLPAFPLDGRMFRGVRKYLDGWVITADTPGFGDSAPARTLSAHLGEPSEPSLRTYARGLALALDEVGAGKVVLAGVSIGGYTTLAFAELFPERLAGIGLLDTRADRDDIDMREYRLRMADALGANEPAVRYLAPLLDHVVSPVTKREREDTFEMLAESFEQAPAAGIAWAQRAMAARPDRLEVLRRLHVPSLVLRGEDDSVSSPAQAAAMAEALGTIVVEVPEAGHMAAVENPGPVARALTDLWERARESAEGS